MPTPMPVPLKTAQTGHIGLNVTEVERSRDFYRALFGFDVITEGRDGERRWVFLGHGGRIVLTLWQQSRGSFATSAPGLHHLSFEVESIDEVRAAEQALKELGAEFQYEGVVAHREEADSGGVFFTDPDGIRLEIFAATGAETAHAPHAEAPTCGFF